MKKQIITTLAVVAMVGLASGSTVSWSTSVAATEGTSGEVLSSGLFANDGTLEFAENVGGNAGTFDGINFTETGTIGDLFDRDDIDLAAFHAAGQLLSRGGSWTIGASPKEAVTVPLTGLVENQEYRIQVFLFDGRLSENGRAMEFDGSGLGQYANGASGAWGTGLLATGTFTADATQAQDFTVETFTDDTYATSVGSQINAITLHAIPEPATLGMVALFGGGILFIRRKLMM